jgi:hypothetical protein
VNIPVRRSRHSGNLETANPEQETATPNYYQCEFTRLILDPCRKLLA